MHLPKLIESHLSVLIRAENEGEILRPSKREAAGETISAGGSVANVVVALLLSEHK